MDDNFDWLPELLSAFIDELLHFRAYRLPLQFAILGPDGSAVFGRYDSAEPRSANTTTIAARVKPKLQWFSINVRLPANMMVVDCDGAAAAILIEGPADALPPWALARSLWVRRRPKATRNAGGKGCR